MLVVLCIMPLYAEEATIKATARRPAREENDDATTCDMVMPGRCCTGAGPSRGGDRSRFRGKDDAESAQPVYSVSQRSTLPRGPSLLSWLPRGRLPLLPGRKRRRGWQAPGLSSYATPVAQRGLADVHCLDAGASAISERASGRDGVSLPDREMAVPKIIQAVY